MRSIDKAIRSCDMALFTKGERKPAHNTYNNRISYEDLKRTMNKTMEDKNLVPVLVGQLKELEMDYKADMANNNLDKNETRKHYKQYKDFVEKYKNSKMGNNFSSAINSFLSTVK